jgi:hypothetical protein
MSQFGVLKNQKNGVEILSTPFFFAAVAAQVT